MSFTFKVVILCRQKQQAPLLSAINISRNANTWYSCGPLSSNPATSSDTPKGLTPLTKTKEHWIYQEHSREIWFTKAIIQVHFPKTHMYNCSFSNSISCSTLYIQTFQKRDKGLSLSLPSPSPPSVGLSLSLSHLQHFIYRCIWERCNTTTGRSGRHWKSLDYHLHRIISCSRHLHIQKSLSFPLSLNLLGILFPSSLILYSRKSGSPSEQYDTCLGWFS